MGAQRTQFAQSLGLTEDQLKRLLSTYDATDLTTCIELLKAKSHRSMFRASLAMQLRKWLQNESPSSTLRLKPLSVKQLQEAKPSWPVHLRIPAEQD